MFKKMVMLLVILSITQYLSSSEDQLKKNLINIELRKFKLNSNYLERIKAAEKLAAQYKAKEAIEPFINILANTSITDQQAQLSPDAIYQVRLNVGRLLGYYTASQKRKKIVSDLIRLVRNEESMELTGDVSITISILAKEDNLKDEFITSLQAKIVKLKQAFLNDNRIVLNISKACLYTKSYKSLELLSDMENMGFSNEAKVPPSSDERFNVLFTGEFSSI